MLGILRAFEYQGEALERSSRQELPLLKMYWLAVESPLLLQF